MFTLEQIVAQHINYALEKTSHLPDKLVNSITNTEIILNDYQYFISKIFIGLKDLNSILLFWDTGMGKTITAVYIMKYIKELFPKWIVLLFIKKSLYLDPWLSTIRAFIGDLNDINNIKFIQYDSSSDIAKFNNIYRSIENSLNKNRVLIIIDEVHKLITRTIKKHNNTERPFNIIFKKIIKLANYENNKLLCMSATPITNSVLEFNNLISLLRNNVLDFKQEFIIKDKLNNFNEIRQVLLGICSYRRLIEADSLTDTNYIEGFASKKVIYHNVIMSDEQSDLFTRAELHDYKSELGGLKTMRRLISSFAFYDLKFKGDLTTEDYNILIKKKLNDFILLIEPIKFDEQFKNLFKNNEISSLTDIDSINNYTLLYQYSCKYIEACKIILNSRGKVLLFEPLVSFEGISTLKYYLKAFDISYIEYSNKTLKTRDFELNEFNKYGNNNGELIKVCIFSYAGSEGISFKCINDVIILDLPWNESELRQIIGRSIRFNSHNDLSIENRYVNVHFMLAIAKNGHSVDTEIMNLIKNKQGKINILFDLLKSSSLEIIHKNYEFIEPVETEYIFNNLRKTRFKESNVTNIITNVNVTPISYCKKYDKATILNGFLNKFNNIIYDDNVPVAKLILDDNGDALFMVVSDKLIFISDDYYE
jgi:hypothetical protein